MSDTSTKHFAYALSKWIVRENMTHAQAGEYLGLSFVRLQQILNGTYKPTKEQMEAVLEKIAHKG